MEVGILSGSRRPESYRPCKQIETTGADAFDFDRVSPKSSATDLCTFL